jgi:hypothetical protein
MPTGTTPVCPFKVGDRVRVNPRFKGSMRLTAGTVGSVRPFSRGGLRGWVLYIDRDGCGPKASRYATWVWDSDTVADYEWWVTGPTVDDVCRSLARSVLEDGDLVAARALADRVIEMCQDQPSSDRSDR